MVAMHMHWTECTSLSLCAYLLKLKEAWRLPTELLAVPFTLAHPPTRSLICTYSRLFSQAHSNANQASDFGCITTRQTIPWVGMHVHQPRVAAATSTAWDSSM